MIATTRTRCTGAGAGSTEERAQPFRPHARDMNSCQNQSRYLVHGATDGDEHCLRLLLRQLAVGHADARRPQTRVVVLQDMQSCKWRDERCVATERVNSEQDESITSQAMCQ